MIIGKTFKFGHGDIAVKSMLNFLELQAFRPPQELGTYVIPDRVEYLSEKFIIRFDSLDETSKLRQLLASAKENPVFDYAGYVFDFTNYDERSVNVVLKHLASLENMILMCMAC